MTRPPSFREARLPLFLPADPPDDDGTALDQILPGRLPSYVRDHRKRLRTRFMEGGAAAMPEYELLELILFRAIPRHDVKPLARLLLDTFGDINRVVTAPATRLAVIPGVGEAVIQELKLIEAVAQQCHTSSFLTLRSALPPGWLGSRSQPKAIRQRIHWQLALIQDPAPGEAAFQRLGERQRALLEILQARGGQALRPNASARCQCPAASRQGCLR
jgi:hypothetical protein